MNEKLYKQIVDILKSHSIPMPLAGQAQRAAQELEALKKWCSCGDSFFGSGDQCAVCAMAQFASQEGD